MLYAPKCRAAFGLCAERKVKGITEGGTKSKIDREVQILLSSDTIYTIAWANICVLWSNFGNLLIILSMLYKIKTTFWHTKLKLTYQVYKYETIFSQKKHVKFERMIKRDLYKICSIVSYTFFPSFGQFMDTALVKIFPFCHEAFIEPFFHIFIRTKRYSASAWPIDANSDNRKEPSLVSKPHGVELPSWVLPTCPELVLPYVMEHCHGEKWSCCLFWYSGRFLSSERFKSINCCW